jgi:hypothetical protein
VQNGRDLVAAELGEQVVGAQQQQAAGRLEQSPRVR